MTNIFKLNSVDRIIQELDSLAQRRNFPKVDTVFVLTTKKNCFIIGYCKRLTKNVAGNQPFRLQTNKIRNL